MRNTNCNTSIINARPLWFTAGRKKIRYLLSNIADMLFYVLRTSSITSFVGEFPNISIRYEGQRNTTRTHAWQVNFFYYFRFLFIHCTFTEATKHYFGTGVLPIYLVWLMNSLTINMCTIQNQRKTQDIHASISNWFFRRITLQIGICI